MLHKTAKRLATKARGFMLQPLYTPPLLHPHGPPARENGAAGQITLMAAHRAAIRSGPPYPKFADVGFRAYSQVDEDGILLWIFAAIGATDRRCVEVCAGDGVSCCTANLIINHNWTGLLVDGDEANIAAGRWYYRPEHGFVYPPQLVNSWVARGNVNDLISSHGFAGDIDLLSLDIDGIDYWLWEAIEVIRPRVVVAEFQCTLGPDRACTVPYSDDFDPAAYAPGDGRPSYVSGASIAALRKLGRRKGYRFVGCNALGYNAFFVRDGVGEDVLPEVDHSGWFRHPKVVMEMRTRGEELHGLPWVDV